MYPWSLFQDIRTCKSQKMGSGLWAISIRVNILSFRAPQDALWPGMTSLTHPQADGYSQKKLEEPRTRKQCLYVPVSLCLYSNLCRCVTPDLHTHTHVRAHTLAALVRWKFKGLGALCGVGILTTKYRAVFIPCLLAITFDCTWRRAS